MNIKSDILNDFVATHLVKFESFGLDTGRSWIWDYYINQQTLFTTLLGFDLGSDPFFRMINFNPHNSFINLHASLGGAALIIIIMIFISSVRYGKNNTLFFLLFLVFLFRASSDSFLFFSLLDFLFYYLFLYFVFYQSNQLYEQAISTPSRREYSVTNTDYILEK